MVYSAPSSGMSGDLEDHSIASALKLSPQKGAYTASGEDSTGGPGHVSSSLADEMVPSALGAVSDGVSHEVVVESQMGRLLAPGDDGGGSTAPSMDSPFVQDLAEALFGFGSGWGVWSPAADADSAGSNSLDPAE
ncbi:hypothetical protein Nepgr_007819 [Nepenthes gracilis]|uniref:Uncharacterized protein n=1 Tax=Nepenthes gracilis TaxID=150966 RepID=A0AAD3S7Z1_NEPGR|nr:hypothetical protein Nepgr_007819 [Nepenthes gracilis]